MGNVAGSGIDRHRDEVYGDMILSRLLKEPPRPMLPFSGDLSAMAPFLGRIGRDRATPVVIRKLLGRAGEGRWRYGLIEDIIKEYSGPQRHSPGALLTVLTQPHRAVSLPDGSWWLLSVLTPDSGDSEEPATGQVAWVYIRSPEAAPSDLITEFEVYDIPGESEALREELVWIAMQCSWKPRVPPTAEVLALLGSDAETALARRLAEIDARAAVEGIHLTALRVPVDSNSTEWQETRRGLLQSQGPVIGIAQAAERSVHRLLAVLVERHGARRSIMTRQPSVADTDLIQQIVQWAADAAAERPGADQAGPAKIVPGISSQKRLETAYLSKAGNGKDYDVLVLTGRRCTHKKSFAVRHRSAPKKFKGVQKFLEKNYPDAQLLSASACKESGCGLVRVHYEMPIYQWSAEAEQPVSAAAADRSLPPDPDAANTTDG